MTEGERIKALRQALSSGKEKMTLEKFGAKIGVGKSAISDIERGRNSLSDQMAKSISREFNVREDWLRTGEGEMFVHLEDEEALLKWAEESLSSETSEFRVRFAKLLARLNDDQWEKLAEFAKYLAGLDPEEAPSVPEVPKVKPVERMPKKAPEAKAPEPVLKAAHARTDVPQTAEGKKHDDDIMDDDSEWE